MAKTRSRRLRKKLHLGEFQELGFFYEATIKGDIDEHAFIDGLLSEAMEPNGLAFGGWVGGGAVSKLRRGSVSEDERQFVLNWLAGRPEVVSLSATGLVDMWHGDTDAHQLQLVKRQQW